MRPSGSKMKQEIPSVDLDQVPCVTTEQMVEVDRALIEDYHIELVQMMENAGRNLADLARRRFLAGDPTGKRVVVLAGSGGNGGGAMVCARRLQNWGADVHVYLTTSRETLKAVPAHQLDILERMRVPVSAAGDMPDIADAALVVDGMIGYSLSGDPRGATRDLICWANAQDLPILSLDAPSGVDTTTGTVFDPAIRATATLTLALPKKGLSTPRARTQVGELYLADISVPPALYAKPGLDIEVTPLFARSEILRLISSR